MTSNTNLQVILTGPAKWDEWKTAFLATVRDRAMEGFVDGTEEKLSRPRLPIPRDFYIALPPAQSTRSSDSTQTVVPEEDEEIAIQHLVLDQRTAYTAAVVNHRYLLDAFHKQTKDIISLREWMRSTVSPAYAANALDTAKDIRAAYLNLETQVGGNKADIKKDLKAEYRRLIKPWTRAPKDIEKWIFEWEDVMQKGERYKLSFTSDSTEWATDFLNTIRPIFSLWVSSYEISNESAIDAGDLSFRSLSGAFRRTVKNSLQSGQASRIGKGSFPALHDEEAHQSSTEMDASHEENGDSDIRKQKGASRKRKSRGAANVRVGDKDLKCRACQGYHELRQCFYLFPKRAYEGWTERENIRRRVTKNLEQDHALAEEVKRLQKGKDDGNCNNKPK
jgi:hypothetical protein